MEALTTKTRRAEEISKRIWASRIPSLTAAFGSLGDELREPQLLLQAFESSSALRVFVVKAFEERSTDALCLLGTRISTREARWVRVKCAFGTALVSL